MFLSQFISDDNNISNKRAATSKMSPMKNHRQQSPSLTRWSIPMCLAGDEHLIFRLNFSHYSLTRWMCVQPNYVYFADTWSPHVIWWSTKLSLSSHHWRLVPFQMTQIVPCASTAIALFSWMTTLSGELQIVLEITPLHISFHAKVSNDAYMKVR